MIKRHTWDGNEIPEHIGMYLTPQHKKKILVGLEEPIRNRRIITHRAETIDQFRQLLRNEKGEPEMPKGIHNDALMAWAGVWEVSKYAKPQEIGFGSFKYREV
jgi:hypothetical protein